LSEKLTREKVEVILHAATGRFATYGYSKVTMDEIAEDIGMAKASLYYYFPTKESIFKSVVQHEQQAFLAAVGDAFQKAHSGSEKLVEFVRLRLKLTERLNNLSHFSQQGWHDVKPLFKDVIASFIDQEQQCLTHILQEGKKNGEFCADHPQRTATMILHLLQGIHMRFLRSSDHHTISDAERSAFEQEALFTIDTLLHGMLKRHS